MQCVRIYAYAVTQADQWVRDGGGFMYIRLGAVLACGNSVQGNILK